MYQGPLRPDLRRGKRVKAQTKRDNERMNGNEERMNESNGGSNSNGGTHDRYNSSSQIPHGIQRRGLQLANGQLLVVIVLFYENFYVIFLFLDSI